MDTYGGVFMYERMLDKTKVPTIDGLTEYCGNMSELFSSINDWLKVEFETESKIAFPYGNNYGWGISHRKKKKLICNVFAEKGAFTVMMRLSDKQFQSVFSSLRKYTQNIIDNKYPCGDGGWIHYRVTSTDDLEDIKTLLTVKLS